MKISAKSYNHAFRRAGALFVLVAFLFNTILPANAQSVLNLPYPGVRVGLSPEFSPLLLKAVKVYPDNPFKFDFIVDAGDSGLQGDSLKAESQKLIRYFLASLTTPENDLWVNLSPYEKDKIIPESFGVTEMGRDLLAQDYLLKQITASMIYPEEELGKKFWDKVYRDAQEKFGTTDIPVNTFNKVWIIPEKAVVYENGQTAYVSETRLKVMLEEDYLAMSHQKDDTTVILSPKGEESQSESVGSFVAKDAPQDDKAVNKLGSQIVREIVIPELTKEVNEGKNFAQLRQVYNSLILANWYKKRLKDSILAQVYMDKNKVAGVDIDDKAESHKIYEQYVAAFKKGVYDYIKEDVDPVTQETVPRKYFSGGVELFGQAMKDAEVFIPFQSTKDLPDAAMLTSDNQFQVTTQLDFKKEPQSKVDHAMLSDDGKAKAADPLAQDRRLQFRKSVIKIITWTGVIGLMVALRGPDVSQQAEVAYLFRNYQSILLMPPGTAWSVTFSPKDFLQSSRYLDYLEIALKTNDKIIFGMERRNFFRYPFIFESKRLEKIASRFFSQIAWDQVTASEVNADNFYRENIEGLDLLLRGNLRGGTVPDLWPKYIKQDSDLIGALEKIVFNPAFDLDNGIETKLQSVKLLIEIANSESVERILNHYLDMTNIPTLTLNQFAVIMAITYSATSQAGFVRMGYQASAPWNHPAYFIQVQRYLLASMKSFGFKDAEKIMNIFTTIAAFDLEWLQPLNEDAQRILREGLQQMPATVSRDNFIDVATYHQLYGQLKRLGKFTIPEIEDYFRQIEQSNVIDEDFLRGLSIKNVSEFGFVEGFLLNLSNGSELISFLFASHSEVFDFQNLRGLDRLRERINGISPALGDKTLILIGNRYVTEKYDPAKMLPEDFSQRFETARHFYNSRDDIFNKDVQGLYRLMGNFMLSRLVEYLKANEADLRLKLGEKNFIEMSGWLVQEGFIRADDPALAKIYQHLKTFNVSYLTHKAKVTVGRYVSNDQLNLEKDNLTVKASSDFPLEEGAQVLEIKDKNDKRLGYVLKVDPSKGGRVKMMADVGRKTGGITSERLAMAIGTKGRLIFDSPVSFTTGQAKPTEIIIEDGEVKNYLISTDGKDGFIITDQQGNVHVADKRNLWIHDLDPQVPPAQDRRLEITRKLDDYSTFLDIAKKNKISLVSNMLLYDGQQTATLNDGAQQRRLFLTFQDGSFGVINPTVDMSTYDATRLAIAAGAVKVVYMDTGQFDYTTIRPLGRAPVVWGHSDQKESSNRIGIYLEKDKAPKNPPDKAMLANESTTNFEQLGKAGSLAKNIHSSGTDIVNLAKGNVTSKTFKDPDIGRSLSFLAERYWPLNLVLSSFDRRVGAPRMMSLSWILGSAKPSRRVLRLSTNFGGIAVTEASQPQQRGESVWGTTYLEVKFFDPSLNLDPLTVAPILASELMNEVRHRGILLPPAQEFEEEVNGVRAQARALMGAIENEYTTEDKIRETLQKVFGNLDGTTFDELMSNRKMIGEDVNAARIFVAQYYPEHAQAIVLGDIPDVSSQVRLAAQELMSRLSGQVVVGSHMPIQEIDSSRRGVVIDNLIANLSKATDQSNYWVADYKYNIAFLSSIQELVDYVLLHPDQQQEILDRVLKRLNLPVDGTVEDALIQMYRDNKDARSSFKENIARLLGIWGSDKAIPTLMAMANDRDVTKREIMKAMASLGHRYPTQVKGVLWDMLHSYERFNQNFRGPTIFAPVNLPSLLVARIKRIVNRILYSPDRSFNETPYGQMVAIYPPYILQALAALGDEGVMDYFEKLHHASSQYPQGYARALINAYVVSRTEVVGQLELRNIESDFLVENKKALRILRQRVPSLQSRIHQLIPTLTVEPMGALAEINSWLPQEEIDPVWLQLQSASPAEWNDYFDQQFSSKQLTAKLTRFIADHHIHAARNALLNYTDQANPLEVLVQLKVVRDLQGSSEDFLNEQSAQLPTTDAQAEYFGQAFTANIKDPFLRAGAVRRHIVANLSHSGRSEMKQFVRAVYPMYQQAKAIQGEKDVFVTQNFLGLTREEAEALLNKTNPFKTMSLDDLLHHFDQAEKKETRLQALKEFSRFKGNSLLVDQLIQYLQERTGLDMEDNVSDVVREYVPVVLGELGDLKAIDILLDILERSPEWVAEEDAFHAGYPTSKIRKNAAEALGKLGRGNPRVSEVLKAFYLKRENNQETEAVAIALAKLGNEDLVGEFLNYAKDHPLEAAGEIRGLKLLGRDTEVAALLDVIHRDLAEQQKKANETGYSEREIGKQKILRVLGKIQDERSLEPIERNVLNVESRSETDMEAIQVIGTIGGDKARTMLLKLVNHESGDAAGKALGQLEKMFDGNLMTPFIQFLAHPRKGIAVATLEFLNNLPEDFDNDPKVIPLNPEGSKDNAMVTTPGGIDLKADKMNLDIRSNGAPIQFDLDPEKLKNLQFDGLVPNIINIIPVTNLPLFLSNNDDKSIQNGQLTMAL